MISGAGPGAGFLLRSIFCAKAEDVTDDLDSFLDEGEREGPKKKQEQAAPKMTGGEISDVLDELEKEVQEPSDGEEVEEIGEKDETENDVGNDNQTIVNEAKTSSRTDNKRALRSKGPVEKLPHVMKKPIEYVECVWNGMICKVPANQFSKQCRSNRRK